MGIRKQMAGVCALVAAALLISAIRSVGFASNSPTEATLQALQYLSSQQSATDGSIDASIAETSQFVVDAAVAGYDPSTLASGGPSAVHYLQSAASTPSPGAANIGYLIQAALAAGDDPKNFGGVDLIARLNGLYSAGVYGAGDAYSQALALIALKAAHQTVPAAAIAYLKAGQDTDGGWNYLASKDNPSGYGSDTNSTAMVLMALDGAGDHSLDSSALTWIKTQQASDGGFAYQAGWGSDPDSDALVLQAIVAAGQDPTSASWSVSGNNTLSMLLASQDSSGGYAYPGSAVTAFTTAQVPLGLERTAYPVDFGNTVYYTHGNGLPTPAPSATPTPSASSTPSPSPTVVASLVPPVSTSAPTPTPTSTATATPQPRRASQAVVTASPTPTGSVEAIATTPAPSPSPAGGVLGIKTVTSQGIRGGPQSTSSWWAYVLALVLGISLVGGAGTIYTRRSR